MDVDSLEGAINSAKNNEATPEQDASSISKDSPVRDDSTDPEEIGFHKGALNTLAAERNELVKMIGNVEAIAGAHAKRLKELGVNVK